jgi:hypothetical protein
VSDLFQTKVSSRAGDDARRALKNVEAFATGPPVPFVEFSGV